MSTLFEHINLNSLSLSNRIVMAPMTRSRANSQGIPSDITATYYAQRAQAGLIITEGVQPSYDGQGYPRSPGIHTQEQANAWAHIATAVHEEGGRIFMQLMHAGRVAHPLNMHPESSVVAPSEIPARTLVYTDQEGFLEPPTPKMIQTGQVLSIIREYVEAAKLAINAGFDGVELHSGSGYLPMQFLCPSSNTRIDSYGGSAINRCRFVVELLEAMSDAIGCERIGMKISPGITFNDAHDDDPLSTYQTLIKSSAVRSLCYLHVQRPAMFLSDVMPGTDFVTNWLGLVREWYEGTLIAGGDFTPETAAKAIKSGDTDLVAFGRSFIANPDLPDRIKNGITLAEADPNTFYTPGPEGYIDYPFSHE